MGWNEMRGCNGMGGTWRDRNGIRELEWDGMERDKIGQEHTMEWNGTERDGTGWFDAGRDDTWRRNKTDGQH